MCMQFKVGNYSRKSGNSCAWTEPPFPMEKPCGSQIVVFFLKGKLI